MTHVSRRWSVLACLAAASVVVAGCTSGGSGGSPSGQGGGTTSTTGKQAAAVKGGTVVASLTAGTIPNFISPLQTGEFLTVANIEGFSQLMWRPLVVIGVNGKPVPNLQRSLYKSIHYSPSGRSVTIQLKPWKWSDGKPITSRDVEFFYNLVRYNKAKWGNYSKGYFPDNVTKFTTKSASTFTLTLDQPYNSGYYTDDQLQEIVPIPQHAWDKTSPGGKVGNFDRTKSGAAKVWKMLFQAGKDGGTFTSNPLWKVIDGPWSLSSYSTNGKVVFVPNKAYSGPKPKIDKYVNLPFTSDTAELNALLAGSQIDVGYVPLIDAKRALSQLPGDGYTIKPWYDLAITFSILNLKSPSVGSMLSQLYLRQAMQSLIPQKQIIDKIYNGYGVVGPGPVPLKPNSPYVSPLERAGGPFPYNPTKAKSLLQSHGWQVNPGGTDVCLKPGSGPGQCGPGVAAGAKLQFTALYTTGSEATDLQYQAIQSAMAQAGIQLSLKSQPFNTVVGIVNPCNPKNPTSKFCGWQLGDYGGWGFSPYPVGVLLFSPGSIDNSGSWVDHKAVQLMSAAFHSTNPKAVWAYEDYVAKQVPFLWLPVPAGLIAYKSNLRGAFPVNPLGFPNADEYYYTH